MNLLNSLITSPLKFKTFQEWLGSDTKENYLKTAKPSWYFYDKKITYELTYNGYRFHPLELTGSFSLFFGCSHVFGLGNHIDDTIPKILSANISLPVINLGQRASSNIFQCVNSQRIIKAGIIPKKVFILWPDKSRTTYFSENIEMHGLWQTVNKSIPTYYQEYLKSNKHHEVIDSYLKFSFTSIWNSVGVDVFSLESENVEIIDRARDNFHWGPKTNHTVADKFIQLITHQN